MSFCNRILLGLALGPLLSIGAVMAWVSVILAAPVATAESADLVSVPPALAEQHARAIRAWQAFSQQDDAIVQQLRSVMDLDRPARRSSAILGDVSLHRFLYPWARYRQPESQRNKVRTADPRFALPGNADAKLHVIAVAGGEIGTQAPRDHPMGEVSVHVTRSAGASVLLLAAYEPVTWRITWDEGVIIEKVIVNAFHVPKVEPQGPLKHIEIVNGTGRTLVSGPVPTERNSYLDYLENIEALAGRRVSTIQGARKLFRYTIDGVATTKFQTVPTIESEAVVLPGSWYGDAMDRLTTPASSRSSSPAFASKQRVSGKWYWEVHYPSGRRRSYSSRRSASGTPKANPTIPAKPSSACRNTSATRCVAANCSNLRWTLRTVSYTSASTALGRSEIQPCPDTARRYEPAAVTLPPFWPRGPIVIRTKETSSLSPLEVFVTDTSAPLVLFLRSYDPAEWRLKLAPNVRVRHLLLYGQYKQTAVVEEGSISSIRAYSSEEGNSDKVWGALAKGQNSRLDLADQIEALLGLAPATMQFDCREACSIDGTRSWRHQSASSRSVGKVTWITNGVSSKGGNRITHPGGGTGDLARVSQARNAGKWYFEFKAEPLGLGKAAWAGGTVGVVDAGSSRQWYDLLYFTSITAGSSRQLTPGSVINVALDLDKGAVYYGINGIWAVGNPLAGIVGKQLKKGRAYYPAIHFSSVGNIANARRLPPDKVEPGTWIGRFTASEFQYAVPAGFLPYESSP